MPLPNELRKTAGDLIRSQDWNALIDGVNGIETTLAASLEALRAALEARVAGLESGLAGLNGEVTTLRSEFDAFRAAVEPLIDQFYRVTLETSKTNYAIGELAELTARVTSLAGAPLDLSDAARRPWVDFVAAWGQLRPVAGFTNLGGAGDRTISVQVNAEGIARVSLRAEHAEDLSDDDEIEVATALTTRVTQTNRRVVDTILEANTPIEAKAAFRVISQEYDRVDASSVRNYADKYYFKNVGRTTDRIGGIFHHSWRDYRSTVMAFAKSDSDPRTPDTSRGACSIQVTFRDWIGPWISLDYMVETGPLVQQAKDRFRPKVNPRYTESVRLLKEEVNDLVRDKGLIGRQRQYHVVREAFDQLDVANPPAFLDTLTRSMQDAVALQQTLQHTAVASIGAPSQEVAFDAFTDVAARADTGTETVRSEVTALQEQVQGQVAQLEQTFNRINGQVTTLQGSLGNLDGRVGALGGRLDATLAEGGEIRRLQSSVSTVSQQVQVLRDLDPSRVQTKLIEIDGIANRLARLEGGR